MNSPDGGYGGAEFDRYFNDAATSDLLSTMFGAHFDRSAPAEVRGFCFVTMTGLERVAKLCAAGAVGPMLDAGCGRGGPGMWLATRLGRSLHGIDTSTVAVMQARELATTTSSPATFSVGALDDTGLASETFSATICLDALHFAVDPVSAAAELLRVTRPGGVLVATTWRTTEGPPRLRQDIAGALASAGWSLTVVEHQPDWLTAQLRIYQAAAAKPRWDDPAVQRLRDEGQAVSDAIRTGERLLIQARR